MASLDQHETLSLTHLESLAQCGADLRALVLTGEKALAILECHSYPSPDQTCCSAYLSACLNSCNHAFGGQACSKSGWTRSDPGGLDPLAPESGSIPAPPQERSARRAGRQTQPCQHAQGGTTAPSARHIGVLLPSDGRTSYHYWLLERRRTVPLYPSHSLSPSSSAEMTTT